MSIDIRTTRNEAGILVIAVSLVNPRGHADEYKEFEFLDDAQAYVTELMRLL